MQEIQELKYKVGDVVLLQIITGEVVMGEISGIDKDIILKKPMSLIMNPMQGGVGLIPYMAVYLGKEMEEATFKEEHIILVQEDFMQEFKDKYYEYSTGIVLEKNPKITI